MFVVHRDGIASQGLVGRYATLTQVTPHGVWGPIADKQGRQASCLGGVESSLPTKPRTTLMDRSERDPKDQAVKVSIQRRPKRLQG